MLYLLESRIMFSTVVEAIGGKNIDVQYRSAILGDLNLDGVVDTADRAQMDAGFFFGGTTWNTGDINGDGVVNSIDYQLVGGNVTGYFVKIDGQTKLYIDSILNIVTLVSPTPDTIIGSGPNINSWIKPGDTGLGTIHIVSSFYQPWSTNSTNVDYIPLGLHPSGLRDPTDSGALYDYRSVPIFGTIGLPIASDVAQGQTGDCYFLAGIESVSVNNPTFIQQSIVGLGDGSYIVQMYKNNVVNYYRVDGDFSQPWSSNLVGGLWPLLMEKAFTYLRYGTNTYASISNGFTYEGLTALNIASSFVVSAPTFAQLTSYIGREVIIGTKSNVVGPLIGSHAYVMIGTTIIGGIQYVTIRNPWGVDGVFADSNYYDGIVTVKYSDLSQSASMWSIANTVGNNLITKHPLNKMPHIKGVN